MKMRSMEIKDKMFDHPTSIGENKKEPNYPRLSLPMRCVEGIMLKLGDRVSLTLEAEVCGLNSDDWRDEISFKITRGACETSSKEEVKE